MDLLGLSWSGSAAVGAYGTATANLVLAVAALRPNLVRRQRWLAFTLGTPAGMIAAWHWLIVCLSVDKLLGAAAVALAAGPIIAVEVMALSLDLVKAGRKVGDRRPLRAPSHINHSSDVAAAAGAHAHGVAAR